ncbi:hypothetical protein Q7F20_00770 [Curtobacterium sp. A7_M15]|uniref:hypothetical protein n=1 Tax=Curtobacterium sp. A7_M15 TaxID=3065241 RepID=UPI00273786D3|nr:hypothetical protein [Curtobacterium sp. A7_M15]MDP4331895.1 hypothetical protein [Curtobacterium sp. A7_M15]
MARTDAPTRLPRTVVAGIWVLAVLFNVALLTFFALYTTADEWAVDRSEATGAFDPSQLLPHEGLLWLVAHAALGLLVVLDGVGVAVLVRERRKRTVARRARVAPPAGTESTPGSAAAAGVPLP